MKHHLWLLAALPLLLAACNGPGPLKMSEDIVYNKTSSFKVSEGTGTFTEKTFGAGLAYSFATWLASNPNYPSTAPGMTAVAVDAKVQSAISKHFPGERIATALKQAVLQELKWKEKSNAPDYKVTIGTGGWGIEHHPLKVTEYAIFYRAGISIEETKPAPGTDKYRSTSFSCEHRTDSQYSHDEVFKDDGAAIKTVMEAAVPECVKQISSALKARIAKDSAPPTS